MIKPPKYSLAMSLSKIAKIIKIDRVKVEYKKNILVVCLNTSELSNEIKFVSVFFKFSS